MDTFEPRSKLNFLSEYIQSSVVPRLFCSLSTWTGDTEIRSSYATATPVPLSSDDKLETTSGQQVKS
jgi:hypothetical protein